MAESPYLDELRLTRFKSFSGAALPLRDLTFLIGRNGSGKSNAIDALQVLAKLAQGDDVRDAIEGHRGEGTEVRGGVRGCAPFGEHSFSLGCSVTAGPERFGLDLTVAIDPDVQITAERLWCEDGGDERALLATDEPDPDLTDLVGRYDNGKQGPNPALPFRATRLLTSQVATKVPSAGEAMQRVHRGAAAVLEALQAVFVLDPVPSLMRQYVPSRDTILRRRAENLSAAIGALLEDPDSEARLRELVQALPEQAVDRITVESSSLGDVVIALDERRGNGNVPVSARVMSDGMLRFLAFATALLEAPLLEDEAGAEEGHTMLVIEEIENGLHPSQAVRVVQLIKEESARRQIRTLATTHSPAMLTALAAEDHEGVVVCDRDPRDGGSRMRRLVDLPSYARAMASGSLGEAVVRRRLEEQGDADALHELDAVLSGP